MKDTNLVTTIDAESSPSALDAVAEAQIGRYVLRGVVGTGGMGVVVAAYDPELDRQVAIKLVTTESDEAHARLIREAQAMARLSHPNVVTVHEVIRIGERAGIVMELVDGEDLATWQRAQAHGWREVVAAYVQAARGLAAAHHAGLVHRDFKPANALRGKDGVVRVTDFGLVRSSTREAAPEQAASCVPIDVSLTRTGGVIGTPAYMAPEQHLGAPVDSRTDQWALACSLYEALYGRRPFAEEDLQQLRYRVVNGTLRPEPAQPAVPRAIRAAIRRALAPRPDDRFPTMDALIAALTPPRRARWIAASIGLVALLSALAVAPRSQPTCTGLDAPLAAEWNPAHAARLRARFGAVGVGYAVDAADRAISALDDYGHRWIAARTQACTQARQGVQSQDRLDRRMRCLDQRLVELSTLVSSLVEADAASVRQAGGAVDQLHPISDCEDPRESMPAPAGAQARREIAAAEADLARAWALRALSQCSRAVPLARHATEVGERSGWTPLVARALVAQGLCESHQLHAEAALATFDRASAEAVRAKDDETLAEALTQRFLVIGSNLGRPSEALAGRTFIELSVQRAGSPLRLQALWMHNLAILLHQQNQQDEALRTVEQAVAIRRKLLSPRHLDLLESLNIEGNIERSLGHFDRSKALLDEVLKAHIAKLGPGHPGTLDTLNNLGILEAARGKLPAAISYWQRADEVARAEGLEYRPSAENLAFARYQCGQWNSAMTSLAAALKLAERQTGEESKYVGTIATMLGATLMALGELDRAGPFLERGLAARRAAGDPEVWESLAYGARLAIRRHDLAAAQARLQEATATQAASVRPIVALAKAELLRDQSGCRSARPAYQVALSAAAKDFDQSVKSDATTGLAECDLDLGAPARALAALEPQVSWLGEVHADASASAPARFALARALWATGGDRGRARTLAKEARPALAAAQRAEATRWLNRLPDRAP
jgi:tetratricopeptide (TPR) repeat protein